MECSVDGCRQEQTKARNNARVLYVTQRLLLSGFRGAVIPGVHPVASSTSPESAAPQAWCHAVITYHTNLDSSHTQRNLNSFATTS
eukprot:1148775-Pelagomonas_calceolata.AAC.5